MSVLVAYSQYVPHSNHRLPCIDSTFVASRDEVYEISALNRREARTVLKGLIRTKAMASGRATLIGFAGPARVFRGNVTITFPYAEGVRFQSPG